VGFGVTFLFAIQSHHEAELALIFGTWVLFCLLYDYFLIQSCRRWLRAGIRRRAAEG
jgi:hypothetical protein